MIDFSAKIKVFGVGGGGSNAVYNMLASSLEGVSFVCANTDAQALARGAEAATSIQLGEKLTKGLGAGADPQVGREAAMESLNAIKETMQDAEMVFVTGGMGGGTGTGAAPVVAQAAKELGILTVGVVTRPFTFEGDKRRKSAEQGIAELRQHVDSLIIIPNDRLLTIAPKNARVMDMFKKADDVLLAAVRGISDLVTKPGYMNLDFADVKTAMSEAGYAMMGEGRATGEGRTLEAARMAITSPLLEDVSIAGAKALLINVTASSDFGMEEYSEAMHYLQEAARGEEGDPRIFMGLVLDENAGDEVRITVIATGIETSMSRQAGQSVSQGNAKVTSFQSGHVAAAPAATQVVPPVQAAAVAPVQAAARQEAPAARRRGYSVETSEELMHIPAMLRARAGSERAGAHAPGKSDFIFTEDSEELELPTFIRRQAN